MLNLLLVSFLIVSIITDIKCRRLFNAVNVAGLVLGVGVNLLFGGMAGLKQSISGMLVGFGILFVFYWLGGLGAGVIKFLTVVGCFKGPAFVAMGTVYGAVFGGVAALGVLFLRGRLMQTIKTVCAGTYCYLVSGESTALRFDTRESMPLPYAAFLSAGMLLLLLERSIG
jgi:prepilin peptidase CpaA